MVKIDLRIRLLDFRDALRRDVTVKNGGPINRLFAGIQEGLNLGRARRDIISKAELKEGLKEGIITTFDLVNGLAIGNFDREQKINISDALSNG